ncbi:cytochrome-c oxidase, cbb3-type subunit III [Pseudomonadota bacterium]
MSNQNKPGQAPDTGHEWDGIRELTNQPPKWWTITFYASLLWVVVYIVLYPSIPLINGTTEGMLGWTSIKEYKAEVAKYDEQRAPYVSKLEGMSAEQILGDQEMLNFANSYTKAIYGDYCAACHGASGQGAEGRFPTLLDDDWLYGGSVSSINETIASGREGMMPGFKGEMSDADIGKMADFVIGLSQGNSGDAAGWAMYEEAGCGMCHADNGKGDYDAGSANLTDAVWRFGSSREDVVKTIAYGVNQMEDHPESHNAVMPSFEGRLSDNDIKLLTVRVWSLGGGEK